MEKLSDYSKFRLKPAEEILASLKDKEKIAILSCKKCFKELKEFDDEICPELIKILNGKEIVCLLCIDFLCDETRLKKTIDENLEKIESAEIVVINSCGIGIQTATEIISKPFYSPTDSLHFDGYHGMSLYEQLCQACGNCYLNYTGGICPLVSCSKKLLNGPCGGAKDGKCEVDPEKKDCGWVKIYEKLKSLNSLNIIKNYIEPFDNSKPEIKKVSEFQKKIKEKREEGFYGGLYPKENKFTKQSNIQPAPEPKLVIIPLLQHTGKICESLVKVGDYVKVGQKIGDVDALISAPVHSSVSGKVVSIEPYCQPLKKYKVLSIIIESDGENQIHETVKPIVADPSNGGLSKEKIKEIVREKGIVGLGGAAFPTHVKLSPPKPIDTFILNGCECEPYLTSDERLMIERPKEIVEGMKLMMIALGVSKGYFVIEDNKPEAIDSISKILNGSIELKTVKTKYPQGAEKVLIKRILGREVPPGGLPLDVGVVVNNVSTAYSVWEAVVKGMPLIKRVITVGGEGVLNGGNFEVKIGMNFKDLCSIKDGDWEIRVGGPMMGIIQDTFDFPIIKGVTGVVVRPSKDIKPDIENSCIKCGRCVNSCPLELYPLYFGHFGKLVNWDKMKDLRVLECFECGCCEYVCPSKIPLVEIIKQAKLEILRKC